MREHDERNITTKNIVAKKKSELVKPIGLLELGR
jgi:hypothetical protein